MGTLFVNSLDFNHLVSMYMHVLHFKILLTNSYSDLSFIQFVKLG